MNAPDMKLLYSVRSPYARKVRVVLREKGLLPRVDEVLADPQDNGAGLLALNPLGKVPALASALGPLYDSPVVCEYLDSLSSEFPLLPQAPAQRLDVLRLQALADGIMDAAVSIVVELKRPQAQRSAQWLRRWHAAIERSVEVLAGKALPAPFDLGAIATACALDYVSFRCPEVEWARRWPALRNWAEPRLLRPSMQDTAPAMA